MSNLHELRTKFIPWQPYAIAQTNTDTVQSSQGRPQSGHIVGQSSQGRPQSGHIVGQSSQGRPQSEHIVGHVYQNVNIGGGMMTQKIPVIALNQNQRSQVLVARAHSGVFIDTGSFYISY